MQLRSTILIAALLTMIAATAAIAEPQPAPDQATLQQILEELRQLRADRDAQKKEIESLRATVDALGRELAAAKQGAAAPPAEAATTAAVAETPANETPAEEQTATVDPYGSLRVVVGSDTDGNTQMRDNVSRIGIKGSAKVREGLDVVATAEVGLKLWGREQTTIFGGDPGAPVGQVDNAVFARVGFVGLKGRAGQLTFGKQWAPYSDVAGMTDQAYVFGGDAAGVYAAGTDGGISGTGRADYATQYRLSNEHFSLGLQTQSRSRSENDKSWADTYQGAFTWHIGNGFHIGAAYHEVRDGVPNPEPDEANEGDKATVVAISYDQPGHLYVGATYADLENHERDDAGVFFSGRGFEVFTRYYLTEKTALEGVYNDIEPDDSYDGDYRLRYFAGTISYRYAKSSVIYAGYKSEQSRAADGSDLQNDVFGLGFNYSF